MNYRSIFHHLVNSLDIPDTYEKAEAIIMQLTMG